MSQPQKNNSSNLIQSLLLMAVVFMGFNLWQQSQSPNKAADTRLTADLWQILLDDDQKALDLTIAKDAKVWEQKFNTDADKAKMPADQRNAQIVKSHVLIAHASFKSALLNPDFAHAKIQRAYDTLKSTYDRDIDNAAVWDVTQTVSPDTSLTYSETTPRQLYENVVNDLAVRNKTEKVYGFFPGYPVIDFLVGLTGHNPNFSYWFAALLLAVIVRSSVWPLSQKQYIWGRQMQQLQPMLKELEAKHRDKKTDVVNQQAYQADAMKMYGEYGLNPLAGCWPAFVQLPFFFTIYQCMQLYKFEFTKGSFLWVNPTATKFLGIHIAPNLGERDYLLIVFYGITMVITTMLTPVSDPTQMKQQRMIGLVFAVGVAISMFFYPLPSAFIVYWIFTNILATGQSLLVSRLKLPPLQKKTTAAGGILPVEAEKAETVASEFFTKTGTTKANKPKGKGPGKKDKTSG